MGQHEKLVARFRGKPKDFTWNELQRLLAAFGYEEHAGNGSRRQFVHPGTGVVISLHKPHPGNELKSYQIRDVLTHLKQEGYL
jgi:predicted RNA binding protein YcfA (HicA-like mRNA interferase family)